MKKNDLVHTLMWEAGFDCPTSEKILRILSKRMERALAEGEDITLRGFGTFKIVTRKPRPVRDFGRKQVITLPERKSVKLIPSPKILNMVNR